MLALRRLAFVDSVCGLPSHAAMVTPMTKCKAAGLPALSRLLHESSASTQENVESTAAAGERRSRDHCYRKLYPWKTRMDLAEHLKNSILYNQDGLIAINKPYGVPVYSLPKDSGKKKPIRDTRSKGGLGESLYSLEDALPALKKCLDEKNLKVVRSTERYTSGVTLLATSEKVANRVAKAIRRSKPLKIREMIYWAITKGYPVVPSAEERVGIKLIEISEQEKQPVILHEFSNNMVSRQEVRPVNVSYHTVVVNKPLSVALLEIETDSVKWNFLHVYAASKVSCVLGEGRYAARVKRVLGRPISVSLHNATAYECEPLADSVCERLLIPRGQHLHVPVMLHQHKLILPQYSSNKEDLVIVAPFPEHFAWTAERLDLMIPQHSETHYSASSYVHNL